MKYSNGGFAQLAQLGADGLELNFRRLVPAEVTNRVSLFTSVMQWEVMCLACHLDPSPCTERLCG